MSTLLSRRQLLVAGLVVPTTFLFGCGSGTPAPSASSAAGATAVPTEPVVDAIETRLRQELVASSRAASATGQWTELAFNDLIDSMGEDSLKRMCKVLSIAPDRVAQYASNTDMKREIKVEILDATGPLPILPTEDPDKILYHEKVLLPVAEKLGISRDALASHDSLSVERAIFDKVFAASWQSLNENERLNFLRASGWELDSDQVVGLAAMAGSAILAGLIATVKLSGFAFYVGMSSGLFAVASSLGITLPFATYMGLSSAVALATSPFGWAAAAILAAAAIYDWIKQQQQSNEAILLRVVLHIHQYRVSAMEQAGLAFTIQGA